MALYYETPKFILFGPWLPLMHSTYRQLHGAFIGLRVCRPSVKELLKKQLPDHRTLRSVSKWGDLMQITCTCQAQNRLY